MKFVTGEFAMPFVDCGAKSKFRVWLFSFVACGCSLWLTAPAFGQRDSPLTPPAASGGTVRPEVENEGKNSARRPAGVAPT
jgi:hypothetical protein